MANSRQATYRDSKRPEYGYCIPAASNVQNEYFLRCSMQIGEDPRLIFKREANQTSTPYFHAAKAMYKRQFKVTDTSRSFGGYYRCIEGCSPVITKLLVEINYGD